LERFTTNILSSLCGIVVTHYLFGSLGIEKHQLVRRLAVRLLTREVWPGITTETLLPFCTPVAICATFFWHSAENTVEHRVSTKARLHQRYETFRNTDGTQIETSRLEQRTFRRFTSAPCISNSRVAQ